MIFVTFSERKTNQFTRSWTGPWGDEGPSNDKREMAGPTNVLKQTNKNSRSLFCFPPLNYPTWDRVGREFQRYLRRFAPVFFPSWLILTNFNETPSYMKAKSGALNRNPTLLHDLYYRSYQMGRKVSWQNGNCQLYNLQLHDMLTLTVPRYLSWIEFLKESRRKSGKTI